MPGLFTHFAILDNVIQNGKISSGTNKFLQDPEMYKYANWGAVGPDYLFFHPADWPGVIGTFFKLYYQYDDLTNEIGEVSKKAGELFGTDEFGFKNRLTGGLYEELTGVIEAMLANLTIRLGEVSLGKIYDLFATIQPPLNKFPYISDRPGGKDYRADEWWWMDIGHHTRTSRYMRNLWQESEIWKSRGDERLRAYAYGYLTHVGGDVIGHPYVNLIVGGPYRNHWRRHSLVEKCLDTYIWDKTYKRELLSSYDKVEEKLLIKNPYFDHFLMPEDIAQALSNCFANTYGDLMIHSGIPSAVDIQQMFSFTYRYIKSTTSKSLFNLPPPPEDFDWWDLPEEVRKTLDRLKQSPPPIYRPDKSYKDFTVMDWKRFFKSLFDHISWIADTIRAIITLPLYAIARVALTPARYIVWLLLNQLYQLYASSRLILVIGAYAHPDRHQLEHNFGHIWTIKEEWLTKYPYKANYPGKPSVLEKMQTYHLVHPYEFSVIPDGEEELTRTSPFYATGLNIQPEKFILDFLQGTGSDWSGLDQSNALAMADQLRSLATNERPVSASDLTVTLFNKYEIDAGAGLPDWNLDGDRGLGWPEWITFKTTDKWSAYNDFIF